MPNRPVSDFERVVYNALQRVPRGCVTTYRLLARHIGCGSAQAVGQALRRNPFAPRVPCHRVVASDLTLGGFRGGRQGRDLADKQALLEQEGVKICNGRIDDENCVYAFGSRDGSRLARTGGHRVVCEGARG